MFYVDETNAYFYGHFYNIIFVAPAVYGAACLYYLFKRGKALPVFFLIMLAVRIFGGALARGISSTCFVFAVGLVYVHIKMMEEAFYVEEKVG